MQPRTLVSLAAALLLWSAAIGAQSAPPPGSAMPGAAAPPRDGVPARTPTGTGRVQGRVLSADTGTPLRRAQIMLSSAQPSMTRIANTDAEGRYTLSNLPAARYYIVVMKSGYATLEFGQQRPFEPGRLLQLAEGEQVEKVDFALPRGSVIAGRVTDEFGDPLPGVQLRVSRYQYMAGGQRKLVSASNTTVFQNATDDLGQYRVYGLMPGTYVLAATYDRIGTVAVNIAEGSDANGSNNRDGFAPTYYPGTANVDEAQTITVGLSQEVTADFGLVPTRLSRVAGIVRDSQGRPAGGVMISMRTVRESTTTGMAGRTAADGTFTLLNVPPGEHFIEVRAPTGTQGATNGTALEEEFASAPIVVAGQDIPGLIITTGPGATLSGRVIFDGTSARPQNPQQPIRAFATAADPSASPSMAMNYAAGNGVVDEAGGFQLRQVNGQVLFRMAAQGWAVRTVTLNGVDITDLPYEAKPSTTVTGLEITMTDRLTNITGTVRTALGDVLKNYNIIIFPAELKEGVLAARFIRTARPDQEGRFQLRALPPGAYVAVAVESLEQGGEWDPAFQQRVKSKGKAFKLTEGQMMALDLQLVQ